MTTKLCLSVEERCSSFVTNLAPLCVSLWSLIQHLAHLMDDEFLHLNIANRAHQHRIQNTSKSVFVEVHHWIALSSMGDSMRPLFFGADDQMIGLSRTSIRED